MNPDFTATFLDDIAQRPHFANHSTLRHVYECLIRGDFEAFGELLSDDAELEIRGAGAMDGSWRGRAQVVEAARINFAQVADQKPEIDCIVAENDCAAVLFRESGLFRQNGRNYRVRAVQWFRFADGRVTRIDEIVAFVPE